MTWTNLTANEINSFHKGRQFSSDMFRAFVKANKFDKATLAWPKNYAKLLKDGRFPRCYRNVEQNMPPYIDHARIFKSTDTGVMCLVYQPYNYTDQIRPEVEQWANENGLKAEIFSPEYSWYYPGVTGLIIVCNPGVNIKVK